jgi:CheY-like chemotaxis protein
MSEHVNSKTLFTKQVQSHSQALCDLLGCNTAAAAPSNIIERCAVATRMLAGTSSLMALVEWEQVLTAYEDLLVRYNESGLQWDERIAGFTSELIEKEEKLVAAYEADPAADIDSLVSAEELIALGEEAVALLEVVVTAGVVPNVPAAGGESAPGARASRPTPPSQPPLGDVDLTSAADLPMSGVISELDRVYRTLAGELAAGALNADDWSSERMAELRGNLHFLNFYACSLEQMMERKDPSALVKKCSLVPLKTVLSDFANEVSQTGEKVLDIVLSGEQTQIDPRLLPTAGALLQLMINDAYNRSEGTALGIQIEVVEIPGAIRWRVTDNGNNFISDSQLDHEDQLAFYPGLKDVRKMLSRNHGVLWVEPRPDDGVRFEFTTPETKSVDSFMVWGYDVGMFGVRAPQLCDLLQGGEGPRGEDSFGEFLTIDNKRVPLLKLETLFNDAPTGGEFVAVIGSLEKRVAFYVKGPGRLVDGRTLEGVVPVWQGPPHLVAQVEDRRLALLDADHVLEGYLDVTGELAPEVVSGGVVDDESEISNGLAPVDADVIAPPDQFTQAEDGDDLEVLVVEQSESLRGVLVDIFKAQRIRAAFADDVDEAIELIHARSPRVIISEFRMPTMAAKVLVEALGGEDNSIPVLVTTSQSGKTADLLVEKLGAAGYLSKPLNQEEVAAQISGYLTEGARA